MEVILKSEVKNLGKPYDVVKVKPGYARNYLLPKGLAVLATDVNKKINAEVVKQKMAKEERIKNEAIDLGKKLSNIILRIGAKVSSSGKIFGSVNNIQIADALKKQYNYDIDRKKIEIENEENIKEVGKYKAHISLHKDVKVTVEFEVFAE